METSLYNGSVALLEEGQVVCQCALEPSLRTGQSLAPSIAEQLREAGWHPRDVGLVAVSHGPGSFTGLRIGITTAKTFAYAVSARVVGIHTLDVVAAQSGLAVESLWAVVDAQRNQLFAARYQRDPSEGWKMSRTTEIVDNEAWLHSLVGGAGVTGPGLRRLQDRLPAFVDVEQEENWAPRASVLGQLGYRRFQGGQQDDVWSLVPQYHRKSAAEEKHDARQAKGPDA
ncbi:MAG: tRNA (adenosine(37)-N6)-threonylcarbamoyltransferase complex dimerization subunit type 1 TsaB [Pirellulaceae bacterium]